MAVQSRDMQGNKVVDGKPPVNLDRLIQAPTRPPTIARLAIAISMAIVGLLLWWLGASASVDGWVIGLNIASDVMRLGIDVGNIVGPIRLVAIIAIGLLYSLNEAYLRPIRGYFIPTIILIAITHLTDVGSTYLFVSTPTPDAWAVHLWAARQLWPAALYSIGLTYLPEMLLYTAWKIARRG